MKSTPRSLLLKLLIIGLLLAALAWLASIALNRSGDASAQLGQAVTPALISQGEYLARVGDCVACHTARGGKAFAGGLGIESPIGTIYSTNITPDKQTGIGDWTYGEFERAIRRGVGHDGSALYPAMPYPSYAKVSDADMQALYAYFMQGVQPVEQANQANDIPWPLSIRWPLAYWRTLFSPSPESAAEALKVTTRDADAQIARGAYLVQGLGHCGSCHTPRALTMQEKGLDESTADYLSGAELNDWAVPSLRGMPHWSQDEIVDYLGTGRNAKASVAGEMTDVVANSTSHMSDDDLHAMAAYLKSLAADGQPASAHQPERSEATTRKLTAATDLTLGERLYLDNCGACHFVAGDGAPRVFPRLDGASVINAQNPSALLHVILAGAQTPSTARAPSILPMPGFADRMDDAEVAELATFLRQGWSNDAPAVSAEQVAAVRASLAGEHVGEKELAPSDE
ncbi:MULTISPECIES: cytochrome c [Pseudomonas]|uniref:Mono/diheme cytochrome c family protein n=1 Tax=Phytopseudomonas flavescens TaxID=29435 RepID=A0A7Y9XR20_9GAMM|nr:MULTISPECIES: cytochrome c [Pseudomonas]MCW2290743.1 mono/diheme cytochrome c family protein [Pseudomonas sp. BIGb0408]NYH74684.1 mono/diheme cytochrome c family protein [Pseudomonas flavescens]